MKKIIGFIIIFIFTASFSFSQSQEDIDKLLETLDNQQQTFEKLANNAKDIDKPEIYNVYIDDDVVAPFNYREVFELLGRVKEVDTVIFKINTNGGSAHSTIAFINAIKNCKAMTIAEIQTAYSAGGIIAMACKKQVVMQYATMMIHSIQLIMQGDINNVKTEIACFKKLNDSLITNSFKNFLTKKEIKYVLEGGVIWLNEDEIKNRLKK